MNPTHCVQEINAEDWTFLTELNYPYTGMLSDLLSQSGIPFVTKDRMGAGMAMKVGPLLERTSFYVPRAHYDCAARHSKNFS